MGAFGKIARKIGLADADKYHVTIAQKTRGVYDHEFCGRECGVHRDPLQDYSLSQS
jgi:hypothetical protein